MTDTDYDISYSSGNLKDKVDILRDEREFLRRDIIRLKHDREEVVRTIEGVYAVKALQRKKIKEKFVLDRDYIMRVSSTAFGVTIPQMKSKMRKMPVVFARNYFFAKMREYTDTGLMNLGKMVNRDHATVIHGLRSHQADFDGTDAYRVPALAADILIKDYFETKNNLQ